MAGFYVHIPFCRQACRYCDFYFTVSLKYKEELVDVPSPDMKLEESDILLIVGADKDIEKFSEQ